MSATLEEVKEAAKAADAHDFIKKLPMQYYTFLKEAGNGLSGGEKQRIALAYGQVWLGLKFAKAIFGTALRAVLALIGTCIASSFGISAAAATGTIKWIIKKF